MADSKAMQRNHTEYMTLVEEVRDTSKSKEEVTAIYDKWSNYEEIVKRYAPNRPMIGSKAFKAEFGFKNRDVKILDAGAGSGLAAEEVVKLGFTNIDALEPSQNLAKQALKKNIYKKWYQAYMCKDRLPIDDNVYDIIYSVGVFAPGQAKEDAFEELIRILKPGGHIMIITGEGYLVHPPMVNFEPRVAELEKEGILIRKKRDVTPDYSVEDSRSINGLVLVLQKPL